MLFIRILIFVFVYIQGSELILAVPRNIMITTDTAKKSILGMYNNFENVCTVLPLYTATFGETHLWRYRGWWYIEGWHSNEICSLMAMMKVSAER